jgi:hypothetical protein
MRDLRPSDKVVYSGKVENVDADRQRTNRVSLGEGVKGRVSRGRPSGIHSKRTEANSSHGEVDRKHD